MGLLVGILLWKIVGAFLVAFGLYIGLAYAIQVRFWAQSKPAALPEILSLRGDEEVLDVGCGLGKMTIVIAKALTSGIVIGVDIWDKIEIPGNSPLRTYHNAQLEEVREKVEFGTANVRALPFADNSFDLVTASSVINNLKGESERLKASREIHRVLAPAVDFSSWNPYSTCEPFPFTLPLLYLLSPPRRSGWTSWPGPSSST